MVKGDAEIMERIRKYKIIKHVCMRRGDVESYLIFRAKINALKWVLKKSGGK
jgi:hypothetical protein